MPRRSKGPRLYLDPGEQTYIIRDGARKRRTGCGPGELARAEEKLRDYIAGKYEPVSDHRPDRVLVADALTFYLREIVPGHAAADRAAYAADRLLDWWKDRPLSHIKKSTCREYVEYRTGQAPRQARAGVALEKRISATTARRELGVLQAAILAYHAENNLDAVPVVTLPPMGQPRDRWLTRDEAAALLRAIRRHPQRQARITLARFVLIGLYTGSRPGVIHSIAWMPSTTGAWVDIDAGVLHRRGSAEVQTNKRRPPIRIPERLLGHMRRWRKADGDRAAFIVDRGYGPLQDMRRSWAWVRTEAGLGEEVVPHILRHTAATWMMQQGLDLWEAAGFLGMSPEILWRVYGHHHPDYQKELASRIGRQRDE